MSDNSTHAFPAPVGGAPDALDLAPSIVFAILYALLVPIVIWRSVHPQSRNSVLLGTSFFSIERVVSYCLRAKAATDPAFRASEGLETYFQTFYSAGFVTVGQDLVNLLRALLVSSTLGGDMVARHTLTPPHIRKAAAKTRAGSAVELGPYAPMDKNEVCEAEVEARSEAASSAGPEFQFEDQTRLRKTMRCWLLVASLLFLLAIAVSGIAGGNYKKAVQGGSPALVTFLWYLSTVLTVVLLAAASIVAYIAFVKLPRVPRTSALLVMLAAFLLAVVSIYRITVFSHLTTSFTSTAPGSQNAPRDKAAFYILHAAPEFLAIALLVSQNVRQVFGTGPFGDLRMRDPKP